MIKINISIACMTNITCGSAAAVSRFEYQCEIVVNLSTSKIEVSDVVVSSKTSLSHRVRSK